MPAWFFRLWLAACKVMTETCAVLSAAGHCAPDEADAYAQMHAKGVPVYHKKLWNGARVGRPPACCVTLLQTLP